MTNSRLYKISAWKDNSVKIVLTQGEGTSINSPTYNKVIQFQCYDSDGLLTIPQNAEITLAIERPDKTTDLISGTIVNDSDIAFDVKNTLTSYAGIVNGEIRITTTSSLVKFYGINFNVYNGISNDAAEISEEFDALTKALQKVSAVTGDGAVTTLDSVIEHGGINPVASGIIYDYLVDNYVSLSYAENTYQKSADRTRNITSDKRTTTVENYEYPSVAGLKDFTFGNFYTKDEIDETISQSVPYELKYTLVANGWENKKQELNLPYEVTANTRIDIEIDNLIELVNVWSGTGLEIEYDETTGKTYAKYLTWDYLTDEIPPIDIELTLRLTEINTIG